MPTNRKRTARRAAGNRLSDEDYFYLNSGVMLDGARSDLDQKPARARRVWKAHRRGLLAEMQRPKTYFCRPWAFWRFDMERSRPTLPASEREVLIDLGLLTRAEEEILEQEQLPTTVDTSVTP